MRTRAIVRRAKAAAAALAVLLPTSACSGTPYPIPKGTDTYYYGYIVSGEKFGVKIGDSREAAKATLSGKYKHVRQADCSSRIRQVTGCTDTFHGDLFGVDEFLRRGVIIVEIQSGDVHAIFWDFVAHPLLDM